MPPALSPHPRLFLNAETWARAQRQADSPLLARAVDGALAEAQAGLAGTDVPYASPHHNEHLGRARSLQTRVVSLLFAWQRTGDERYRQAVWEHLRAMGEWEYWSWITWREGDARPEAIFDLSYGENCATLALAYDLLAPEATPQEREIVLHQARDRAFKSFLHQCDEGEKRPFWYGAAASNWNTVCAGGAGMLALALWDELPDLAARVLDHAETSIRPFFQSLDRTGGAWPEGIGYWNYGFRYGFMYLLSHEQATGHEHPLLDGESVRQTLGFPIDFCPNGVPCSFGDVNHWEPHPFHLAAALRLGRQDLVPTLLQRADQALPGHAGQVKGRRPVHAEWALVHPGAGNHSERTDRTVTGPHLRWYRGQDWALLADSDRDPRLALTVRGGTTEVPHGHVDLTSFHLVVGSEAMVTNLGAAEYLDTTFSERRWELFEMVPAAKNVLLCCGVGVARPSQVAMSAPDLGPSAAAVHLDATEALGGARSGQMALFYGRLFVLFAEGAALVLDHLEPVHAVRLETRFYTRCQAKLDDDERRASLTGEREAVQVAWAASHAVQLQTAGALLTKPGLEATAVRCCVSDLQQEPVTLAKVFTPGDARPRLALAQQADGLEIHVGLDGWDHELFLDHRLRPRPPS